MAYPKKTQSKEGIYTVYMHTMKPTGKRYIGCTGQDLERRFQHGIGYEKNAAFYSDIMKYGWDSVETSELASTSDFELATQFENAAIQRYETLDSKHGYNAWTSGSDNKPNASVGRNISKARMGHEVTDETRKKLSEYGNRPVVCLRKDGTEFWTYGSITEAAKSVNSFKSNIWAVCMGRKKSCKGYVWMFQDRWNSAKQAELKDRVTHTKPGNETLPKQGTEEKS